MPESTKIGLYLGDYAHLSGLWAHWVHALRILNYRWTPLWDSSFSGGDAFPDVDILIVPGGFGWNRDSAFGGERGRQRIQDHIKSGATYIGTCYGANIAMTTGRCDAVHRLGLIEGEALDGTEDHFVGTTCADYELPGKSYVADRQPMTHINGPGFGDGDYEVVGRYSANQPGPFETKPTADIAGRPAAIMADYGKGRVYAFSEHPEMPLEGAYDGCINELVAEQMVMNQAVQQLSDPPAISAANVRLLQVLLDGNSGHGDRNTGFSIDGAWRAERIGMLSTSKVMLKQRYEEVGSQVGKIAKHAQTPALQCACQVVGSRLQKIQDIISGVDPQAAVVDPDAFAMSSLVMTLERLYCNCEHSGLMQHARLDNMISEAQRLTETAAAERVQGEAQLARRMLTVIVVRGTDPFIYACGES